MTEKELKSKLDDLKIEEMEEYQKAKENAERNNQMIGLDSFGDIRRKYIRLRDEIFTEYNISKKYEENKWAE